MNRIMKVYKGRENWIPRVLTRLGEIVTPTEAAEITQIVINIGDVVIDSLGVNAAYIEQEHHLIRLQLGMIDELLVGGYEAYITVFTITESDEGLAWGSFPVQVEEWLS